MKTTLSEREGNTVKLAVEVSGEELQEAFDKRLKQLSREVRFPGFRPGKAPISMVRQRLGDEAVLADTIEESMSGWFTDAVIELGLDPVDRPEIDLVDDAPELGKTLSFTATVTVMPEVVLGEYKGLEAPREPSEAKDEEVDEQMDRLRNQFAELRPISDRPAQTGDFVTTDLSASLDGEPVSQFEAADFVFEVGGGRIFAEIEENVAGMSAGEERTFPMPIPEGIGDEALEGKTVECKVVLKEIKEKVLPQITDRWASEVSEFETLLELRQEIRSKIQESKTRTADQRFRALAVKAASDNATLDMPEVVVREQAEEMLEDFRRSLEAQGGTFDAYVEATGTTVEQMIEDMMPAAANNVKTGLVLDEVAKAEGIEAGDEELRAAVAQMAAGARVDAKAFEERLRKTGRIEAVRWQIIRDKAADFIMANAIATEPEIAAGEDADGPAKAEEAKPKSKSAAKPKPAAKPKSTAKPKSAAKKDAAAETEESEEEAAVTDEAAEAQEDAPPVETGTEEA